MFAAMVLVAASAVGVEPGWEKLDGGGWRYYIQIDPENLKALAAGEPIESDIPPELWDIRSYRVVLGGRPVPREPLPDISARPKGPVSPGAATVAGEPGRIGGGPSAAPFSEGPRLGWPGPGAPPTEGPAKSTASPGFEEQTLARPRLEATEGTAATGQPEKPWLAMTIASSAAFGCFGGMLYAGWIAWDYRRRYRQLFAEMIAAGLKAEG